VLKELPNKALQQTGLSVAALPLAPAAERRYVGQTDRETREHLKSFNWYRASLAFAVAGVLLALPSLRPRFEPGTFDNSPFADVWALCDRIAFGWPFSVFRHAADPKKVFCSGLPDIDVLALAMDISFVGVVSGFVAVIVGVLSPRRAFDEPPTL
jgi:hypothetical protein